MERNFCYALGDRADICVIECNVYGAIVQSVFASDKRFSVKNEMPDFADMLKFLIRYEDMLRRLQVKK